MKACPYCGAKYPDEATNCVTDGTLLVTDAPPAASTVAPVSGGPLGLAISAFVLGILSVALSIFLIGGLLAVVAIILGLQHLRKGRKPDGMARWGIGLAVFGILATLGVGTFYYHVVKELRTAMLSSKTQGDNLENWEGVKAPDFEMVTLEGKELKLSDFKGKRVVLDFWATWCPPCRKELPHFVKLYGQTPREKVVIIGISDEAPSKLKKFVRENGITYPIATGTNLPEPYKSISAIPATFYIDTKGTIQKIAVGYHEYSDIRSEALANDFQGEVKSKPAGPPPLAEAAVKLTARQLWSKTLPGAAALCAGAWQSGSEAQALVASGDTLHVIDLGGQERGTVRLPETFQVIECGRSRSGPRLLGYGNWGHSVAVIDSQGKELWKVSALMGVDGAHWGDLDGDGFDELVVGMNGSGGLQAWSSDNKKMWSATLGNVWNQAVVPAASGQPGLVLATEAGGAVKLFDPAGSVVKTLKPRGGYYAQMGVCQVSNTVQIAAINGDEIAVFDVNGNVAWTAATKLNHGGWRTTSFASGDLDGDGTPDWVFVDKTGDLVIANTRGEKLSSLAGAGAESFAVAPRKNNRGLLLVLGKDRLSAYELTR